MEKIALTKEEISRIACLYVGQPLYHFIIGEPLKVILDVLTLAGQINDIRSGEAKIALRPLSAITNEDAIEVADKMLKLHSLTDRNAIFAILFEMFFMQTRADQSLLFKQFHPIEFAHIHQHLISKGYEVPLFFAPDHNQ